MPFLLIRQDITKMQVDAIVNAANTSLLGGGGVDGAIHRAAGPRLLAKCITLGGCKTGDAKITPGYNLPAKYIIHTVGPVYHDGQRGEPILLASCYQTSLQLAHDNGCETVAFPLISAGVYGYPRADAIRIAAETIRAFLCAHDDAMTVYLVIFDRASMDAGRAQFPDIAQYIDDRYADAHTDAVSVRRSRQNDARQNDVCQHDVRHPDVRQNDASSPMRRPKEQANDCAPLYSSAPAAPTAPPSQVSESASVLSLEDRLAHPDESFSEMLLRKIDEAGMTDAACYKKANIDRKLFSKIRSDRYYKPSKQTVLAFAIALRMPLDEVREMLGKAGFALSHANKFDIIVEYFLEQENYDVFAINEALFAFDQTLLGA